MATAQLLVAPDLHQLANTRIEELTHNNEPMPFNPRGFELFPLTNKETTSLISVISEATLNNLYMQATEIISVDFTHRYGNRVSHMLAFARSNPNIEVSTIPLLMVILVDNFVIDSWCIYRIVQ